MYLLITVTCSRSARTYALHHTYIPELADFVVAVVLAILVMNQNEKLGEK